MVSADWQHSNFQVGCECAHLSSVALGTKASQRRARVNDAVLQAQQVAAALVFAALQP